MHLYLILLQDHDNEKARWEFTRFLPDESVSPGNLVEDGPDQLLVEYTIQDGYFLLKLRKKLWCETHASVSDFILGNKKNCLEAAQDAFGKIKRLVEQIAAQEVQSVTGIIHLGGDRKSKAPQELGLFKKLCEAIAPAVAVYNYSAGNQPEGLKQLVASWTNPQWDLALWALCFPFKEGLSSNFFIPQSTCFESEEKNILNQDFSLGDVNNKPYTSPMKFKLMVLASDGDVLWQPYNETRDHEWNKLAHFLLNNKSLHACMKPLEEGATDTPDFYLALCKTKWFCSGSNANPIFPEVDMEYQGKHPFVGKFFNANPILNKPVITLGAFDIMSNEALTELEIPLDPRFRFWDSCIWFRYLHLEKPGLGDRLQALVNEIRAYTKDNYYSTSSALEFLEFQLRLLLNAHLHVEGVHTKVKPFIFHSESKMQEKSAELLPVFQGLQWCFMLADDRARTSLHSIDAHNKSDINKSRIIENAIKSEWPTALDLDGAAIRIQHFENIADARNAILGQEKPNAHCHVYDVILMDYLFKNNDAGGQQNEEYGIELISQICEEIRQKDGQPQPYLGPNQKLWILPISVFANVLSDTLRILSIPHYHTHWVINAGANPLCSPHLFRHELFQIMRQQMLKVADVRTNNGAGRSYSKLAVLLEQMVEDGYIENTSRLSRSVIKQYFPKFIELGVFFNQMYNDREKSLFAKSAHQRFFFLLDKFDWDHFISLHYLLANGSPQQKGEMLEEYIYFRKAIEYQQNQSAEHPERAQELASILNSLNKIRNHITAIGREQ